MAEKKVPTQSEAVNQVNQISANPNDKPEMIDPIIYNEGYKTEDIISGRDPKKLNNADMNISQYWDDSSAKNYNNSQLWWGENQKYSWENTKNSQVAYNPNATIEGLDPNYKYWQAAQMANSEEANYIAKRNDEIASALYNAWKTSMEDVANYLNQQEWFKNSYENERQNTILSVWKRLGEMWKQNQQNDTNTNKSNNVPSEEDNDAVKNMESDLNQSTAWKIYGKVTADENSAITTLEDDNSVYKVMNESRINNFKKLNVMDSQTIAASIISGSMAADSQTLRDLMQYNPAKYQEVQNAIKQIRWQMNINTITSGEWEWNTSATNWQSSISNEKTNFAIENSWTWTNVAELLKSIDSSLNSNVGAATAEETMDNIKADMANLQKRLKNLKSEANQIFKWDVPQYIVNAYIANRTQEIQDQMEILESRYDSAYSRYQDEWEKTKWYAEFDVKKQELEIKKQSLALDIYAKEQWIAIDWYKAMWNSKNNTTNSNSIPTSSLSREEISWVVDQLIQWCKDGTLGKAQCAAWIQKNYLPYLWVDLGSLSYYWQKQGICNEFASDWYIPQKWDLVVMESSTKPENWHIWMVTWVDEDWTLHYIDWNGSIGSDWNWTEEAAERTKNIKDSNIYGYYNPTKSNNINNWYYDPSYSEIYGKYLQGKFAAWKQLETQASAMWKTVQQLDAEARAWKESQKNSQDVTTRLDAIARLINTSWDNRGWRILSDYSIPQLLFSWYADFDNAYNFVKDNITFDKLLELKRNGATFWALSDNELRAIGNAAANLSKNMSDEEFKRQLTWIYNELLRGIWEEEMTTSQISSAFSTKMYTPTMMNQEQKTPNTKREETPIPTPNPWLSPEEKARQMQWF